MTRPNTCGNCRFWLGDRLWLVSESTGDCRRHAPRTFVDRNKHTTFRGADWPTTNHASWCGDHEPVEPAPTDDGCPASDPDCMGSAEDQHLACERQDEEDGS